MSAELMHGLPQVQRLALSYAPAASRSKFLALFALETRLAGIVRSVREPILAQLRLAWWRDRLTSAKDGWPHGDAVLDALRDWRDPSGLGELVNAWEALLAEQLTAETIETHIAGRADAFAMMAREIGTDKENDAVAAGRCFAQADLAANLGDEAERSAVLSHVARQMVPRLPRTLRPLSVLAGLGRSAMRKGGSPLLSGPASVFLALRIGLTGR